MGNVSNRQLPHNQNPAGWPTTTNAAQPTTQPWPTVRMPTVTPAAAEILRDAVFHLDAAEHQANGANPKTVRNLGWGGAALNARCGSTTVADTNDPLFLPFYGTPYMYVPGTNANSCTLPDAANLRLTGNIDLRARIAVSLPLSRDMALCYKIGATDGYTLYLKSAGKISVVVGNGSGQITRTATVAISSASQDNPRWIRATFVPNDGAGNNVARFYESDDGSNWTEVGTAVTTAGTVTITPSNSVVYPWTDLAPVAIYRAQIYDGINGTLVMDVDTSVIASGSVTSFTALTGQTVTINRATSGRKSVAVVAPVWLFGTDDYMEVRDCNLLNLAGQDSMTLLAVRRVFGTSNDLRPYIAKRNFATGSNGYQIRFRATSQDELVVVDGQSNYLVSSAAFSSGSLGLAVGVIDRVNAQIGSGSPQVKAAAQVARPVVNNYALRIGAEAGNMYFLNGEIMSAAIFRRALSASEIATLTTYYQGKYR